MNRNVKSILRMAAALLIPLMLTGCEDILGIWDKPTPAVEEPMSSTDVNVTVTCAIAGSDVTFAAGDKLYVTGTGIKGVIEIQSGAGTANATFSGSLSYTDGGTPADDLELTATLVNAQQTVGAEVSVDAAGAVTVNYPTTAYCIDITEAKQKYSRLTGTTTYGAKSFSLSQQTSFLDFVITFADGTLTNTALSTVVSNSGSAICTGNVTSVTESTKVVAKFVLPLATGITLTSAKVQMDSKEPIAIADGTLTGNVVNVNGTIQFTLAALKTMINSGTDCSAYIGYQVNSDGIIAASDVSGTLIGYVAYISTTDVDTDVSGSRILVIANSDDAWGAWGSKGTSRGLTTDGPTGYSFTNTLQAYGNSADTGHPAAYNAWNHSAAIPTGGSTPAHWFLPTQNQLNSIITAVGGFSQMTKVGWYYDHHWTSTEYNDNHAIRIDNAGIFPDAYYKESVCLVRACFAY